ACPRGPGAAVLLSRVASDLDSPLQDAPAATWGASLRFRNEGPSTVDAEVVRVRRSVPGDGTYRVRAYETTARFPRFNNLGETLTVVVLQQTVGAPVSGTLWFWDGRGALLASQAFDLPPRGVLTLDTRALVPGQSGSITVTH